MKDGGETKGWGYMGSERMEEKAEDGYVICGVYDYDCVEWGVRLRVKHT